MFYTLSMLRNQYYHDNIIVWPFANPYINDQFQNTRCLFSQNVDFRLNTLLHGALQLLAINENTVKVIRTGYRSAAIIHGYDS